MDSKKLLVSKSPIVGLQYLAFPLAVLLNHKECLPWFYSNYIQLEAPKDSLLDEWNCNVIFTGGHLLDIPCFKVHTLPKKHFCNVLCKDSSEIINNINGFLSDDWYFISHFDEYYIPNRSFYQKEHRYHDFLINGFNNIEGCYNLIGFATNEMFMETEVKYDEFVKGISSDIDPDAVFDMIFYRKRGNFRYDFDLPFVKGLLMDYLNSKDSSSKYRCNISERANTAKVYCMEVYSYLKRFYESCMEIEAPSDMRPIHLIWEHKNCMLLRLKYMFENNIINYNDNLYNSFKKIENMVLVLKNMSLKFFFTENKRLLVEIINSIDKIKILDQNAIEALLEEINKSTVSKPT